MSIDKKVISNTSSYHESFVRDLTPSIIPSYLVGNSDCFSLAWHRCKTIIQKYQLVFNCKQPWNKVSSIISWALLLLGTAATPQSFVDGMDASPSPTRSLHSGRNYSIKEALGQQRTKRTIGERKRSVDYLIGAARAALCFAQAIARTTLQQHLQQAVDTVPTNSAVSEPTRHSQSTILGYTRTMEGWYPTDSTRVGSSLTFSTVQSTRWYSLHRKSNRPDRFTSAQPMTPSSESSFEVYQK